MKRLLIVLACLSTTVSFEQAKAVSTETNAKQKILAIEGKQAENLFKNA